MPNNETPEWVAETPEISYNLVMLATHDGAAQEILLTRDEFIELKRHLAKVRGYVVAESNGSQSR